MNDISDIGVIISEETKRRLSVIESENYMFPERAGKHDVTAIIVAIALCGILILGCMVGVII